MVWYPITILPPPRQISVNDDLVDTSIQSLTDLALELQLPELQDLPAVVQLPQFYPRFVADNESERGVSLLDKVLSGAEDFLTELLAPLCCQ